MTAVGLVTQLPEDFYSFMLELQGKLAKMIKSVGKIDHALYPFTVHTVLTIIFTALHAMQTRYCEENSVRPSVRPSVRHTRDP